MAVKKVTIDRVWWLNGRSGVVGALLSKDRRRCCLGFLGAACGLEDIRAQGAGFPSDLRFAAEWPPSLFEKIPGEDERRRVRLTTEDVLVCFNDDKTIDDPTRESWIAAGFKYLLGIEVEFVGSYPGTDEEACSR